MNLLTEYIRKLITSGWTLPLNERPQFFVMMFSMLIIARWLWRKGDRWTWGEERVDEAI